MTALDRLQEALSTRGIPLGRRVGREFVTLCPAHDDKDPSLNYRMTADGTLLIRCRSQECPVDSILAALDLGWADILPPRAQPDERPPAVDYRYHDAEGNLVFAVERRGHGRTKKFVQKRPAGNGTWIYNLNGVTRVPYQLPSIARAIATGREVLVVEGEKDVHTLAALGFCATTNPGGAAAENEQNSRKWPREWGARYFGRAKVVVIPDNDEAGFRHAQWVASTIPPYQGYPRLLELPGLPDKGDVTDWVQAGGTAEEFRRLLGAASPFRLHGLRLRAYSAIERRAVEWLWNGRIPLRAVTLLGGNPGEGKSFVSLAIASTLSLGRPWPGEPDHEWRSQVGTILVTTEDDPERVTSHRLDALGADGDFVQQLELDTGGHFRLDHINALPQMLSEFPACRLVIIDPMSSLLVGGDTIKETEIRGVMEQLEAVARECDVAVLAVMHLNKADKDNPLHRLAGSLAFGAAARSVFLAGSQWDDTGRRSRSLVHVKSSYGPETAPLGYSIEPTENPLAPSFYWMDVPEVDVGRLVSGRRPTLRVVPSRPCDEEIIDWLATAGPQRGHDLESEMKARGFTRDQVAQARSSLRESGRARLVKDGQGPWWWMLPAQVDNAI